MAQDFGDDAGERLERGIMRLLGELVRGAWRHHAENKRLTQQQKYYEQRLQQEGTAPETATVAANAMAQREQVCIPFGSQADAAYFAQVCRDNGTYVTALYDQSGNGYIEFAADDLARVQQSVLQFSEVMTQLTNEQIAQTLENAKPLTESQIGELKENTDLPDLPGRDATERDAQSRDEEPDLSSRENPVPNHTEHIAQEVAAARAKCSTFEELQTALAQRGIGTTVTKDGEAMFYEARTDADGKLLPFGRDAQGNRDWAVGAKTLRDRWGVDATHDSFSHTAPDTRDPQARSEPQVADGSLDADGRTSDINQGIDSHDGMDTDTRTLRLEREQNGTDVAPSKVREESEQSREASHDDGRGYSLDSEARDMRSASKQLEHESGAAEREIDISDKMSQVR